MKTFVVTISDAAQCDRLTPVAVQEGTALGKVAQMAVDEFIETHGGAIRFPLFIDIHPAEAFGQVHWLQPGSEERQAGVSGWGKGE